jgi:D-threo-aldose 1-dehydrogenase
MKLLDVADADVCLLASQYSLIDHENALHHDFPAAHAKGVSFVVGSSLNAGFISGTTTVRKTTRFRSRSSKSAKSCAR